MNKRGYQKYLEEIYDGYGIKGLFTKIARKHKKNCLSYI